MEDHMPLQAANVLCWHIQRGLADGQVSENVPKLHANL